MKKNEKSEKYYTKVANRYDMNLKDFAFCLGDREAFAQFFLKPHYNNGKIAESIMKELNPLKDAKDYLKEKEIENILNELNERKRKEFAKSKLELTLEDISIFKKRKNLKKLTNVATSFMEEKFPYGALHAGLKIDEVLIDWEDESIVCPRINLQSILFSFYLKNEGFWNKMKQFFKMFFEIIKNFFKNGSFGIWDITVLADIEINLIAKICVSFNRYKTYDKFDCNCQHFVTMILKELNCENSLGPELQRILREIQKNGNAKFPYKGTEFTSRIQFDNYVSQLNFKYLFNEDKILLLCYNNNYDIKEQNDKDNPLWKTNKRSFWENMNEKYLFNN